MDKTAQCLLLAAFCLVVNISFAKKANYNSTAPLPSDGMHCSHFACSLLSWRTPAERVKEFVEAIAVELLEAAHSHPGTNEAIHSFYQAVKAYKDKQTVLDHEDHELLRGSLGLQWRNNAYVHICRSGQLDAEPLIPLFAVESMVQILRASGLNVPLDTSRLMTAIWSAQIWLAISSPDEASVFKHDPELMMAAFLFFLIEAVNEENNPLEQQKTVFSWLHHFLGRHMQYSIINEPTYDLWSRGEKPLSEEQIKQRAQFDKAIKPITYDDSSSDEQISEAIVETLVQNPENPVISFRLVVDKESEIYETMAVAGFRKDGLMHYRLFLQTGQVAITVMEKELSHVLKHIRTITLKIRRLIQNSRPFHSHLFDAAIAITIVCVAVATLVVGAQYFRKGNVPRKAWVSYGISLVLLGIILKGYSDSK